MKKDTYPLQQVEQIKQKRLEEAERVLKEKKEQLETEEQNLKRAEEKRDEVKKHKAEKLEALRQEMDRSTTSEKVLKMRGYIQYVVDEKLTAEEKKVEKQTAVVEQAKNAVEEARQDYVKKNQEVEKIKLHKEEWLKQEKKQEQISLDQDADEIGSSMHILKGISHPFKK